HEQRDHSPPAGFEAGKRAALQVRDDFARDIRRLGDWQRQLEAKGQVAAQEAEAIKLHAQARWQMTVAQALEEGFKATLGGGVDNVAAAPAGAGNAAEADYGAA